MYAGMTDIAAIYHDNAYLNAVNKLWENMVNKKMYITGGIGARHQGESFGDNYELPNLSAYSETCAAIGSVYWNHRMFLLTGDAKYYDIIERTLYNGMISGISLDGDDFFYPNPLESDGKFKFNHGSCTRQPWFDCSCCPSNLIRFIPSVPNLVYATIKDTLYINLFISNEANVVLDGKNVQIIQNTDYPWKGEINITVNPSNSKIFTVKLRIPGWTENKPVPGDLYTYLDENAEQIMIMIDRKTLEPKFNKGYIEITRKWKKGDLIEIQLPMKVQRVIANEAVKDNLGLVAFEYGPVVYCGEEIDNEIDISKLVIPDHAKIIVEKRNDLLGGVNVLSGNVSDINSDKKFNFHLTPYFAWSNRGIGKMKVWFPRSD